jgi:hypothetical protein
VFSENLFDSSKLCGVSIRTAYRCGLNLRSSLRLDRGDTKWMDRAVCDSRADWTPDRLPSKDAMAGFALVCYECPVRRQCANYAIDNQLDNGIYAGIYVPTKLNEYQRRTLGFSAAMNQLARIAGRGAVRQRCRGVRI